MLELIKTYYAYNTWATELVLAACEHLTPEEFHMPGCSGNGSTWQTLDHLINVQWGWFSWYDGSKEMKESIGLMLTRDLNTIAKARQRWTDVNRQTNAFLNTLTEKSVKEVRSFTRSNGKQESHPLWKLMMHTANHGTHTRAQIVAAIRRAGHDPGNVDLLNYVLNVEGRA